MLSVGPIPPEWGGRLRGGVSRFHATLLDELRTRPWRHRIEPAGVLIPPPQRVKRWRSRREAPLPVFMQPADARPRRFTRGLLERVAPDVVLVNNVAAFAPSRYTRVHEQTAPQLPLVGIVHAWHQVTHKRDPQRAEQNRAAAQDALDRLAAVAFGSEHCRAEGRQLGFRYPQPERVIPYPLQDAYLEDFEIEGKRSGVLFLGSLNRRKNPMALLEAVAGLPGLTLTFAGEGGEEPELRRRADALGIADRVRFVPHQDPKIHVRAMRELVARAEVLCLPSRSESFGIVMIEALAAGTPVVGFGPTFEEIRNRTGVEIGCPVWDGTPEEIAVGIEQVRAQRWSRARLRKRALAGFSPSAIARDYARLIRSVARSA